MRLTNTIAAVLAAGVIGFSGAALAEHHEEADDGVVGAVVGGVEAVADAVTGDDDAAAEDEAPADEEAADEDAEDDAAADEEDEGADEEATEEAAAE